MKPTDIADLAQSIRSEVAKAVVGQDESVDLLLCALFARGHMLLEGPPGVAKTLLAQTFAQTTGLEFGRIQFTPDLMPGDILGSNIFNFQTSAFSLTKGPVFSEILLADEINRTPPKTQAALLEAMQERAVTIDGERHTLSPWFLVVATQNPIEHHGTYPLPEAQLDRFLLKHVLDYPSEDQERMIVSTFGKRNGMSTPQAMGVAAVADHERLSAAATAISEVRLAEEIVHYIVAIIRATRENPSISTGASPRAGAMLAAGARAKAALDGRDYVVPDDVKSLVLPALRHRLVLSPAAEIEGRNQAEVVLELLDRLEPPR